MLRTVLRAAVVAGLGLGAALTLSSSSAFAAPELKVLVVDQQGVLRDSLAGQDIGRQAAALRDQIQAELTAEQKAIIAAQQDLQKNGSIYSPAQREQKLKALEARQQAYPMFEQRKSQILQSSIGQASDQLAAALRPVLQTLIDENHATLLLDRSNVMYSLPAYDVTQEAIKRLNARIASVKVVRVNLDSVTPDQGAMPPAPRAASAPSPAPATAPKPATALKPLRPSSSAASP
ncbi:MAG: OmpH family outer membrane protein [Alphaproteobacteria bacterium]